MTDLLKRLEREGSIERRADPNNRRADRWFLLPAGSERLAAGRRAGSPAMTQMLSLLSGQEVGELKGYLERCVEGLERENRREALPPPLADCATPIAPPKAKQRAAGANAKQAKPVAKPRTPARRPA
jgi:hypothetical protein